MSSQEVPDYIRERQRRVLSRNRVFNLKRVPIDRRMTAESIQRAEEELCEPRIDKTTLLVFGIIALEIACIIGICVARSLGWIGS